MASERTEEFYDAVVKNAEVDDSSDDEEAFADAMDKLPQPSSDPDFARETTEPPRCNSEEDDDETGDEKEDEKEESKESAADEATRLRKEAEERLSPEELEARRVEALDLKSIANNHYVSNEFQQAVDIYTEALDKCPLKSSQDRSVLYSNRAAAKLKMEQNESALEDCSEALKQNPTYLKALVRRAQLYEDLDRPHESMSDYQEVLKLDPNNIQAKVAVATRLPEKIKEKDEKMKAEMMDNLKKLGNMVLNPFGLSTNNFNFVQDPNTGGYSVNFSK